MRRLRPPPRRRDADDGVLPLINVVFLLLIFFLVAGRLASGDPFMIQPPQSRHAGGSEDTAPLLLLAADGRLALDGEAVTLADLPAALGAAPTPLARLKADAATDTARVVEVMQALHGAGVTRVRLLALAPSS